MNRSQRLIGAYSMLAILLILFILGTFYDYQISSVFKDVTLNNRNFYGEFFEIWGRIPWSISLFVCLAILINYLKFNKKIKIALYWEIIIYSLYAIGFSLYLILAYYNDVTRKIIMMVVSLVAYWGIYAFIGYYYMHPKRQKQFEEKTIRVSGIIWIVIFIIAMSVSVEIMKNIFVRTRPINVFKDNAEYEAWYQINYSTKGKSFPSGHTSAAVCAVLPILFVIKKEDWKYTAITGVSWLIILLVAFSRVTLLKHYVTDVVMSCLLGFGYFFLLDYFNQQDYKWIIKINGKAKDAPIIYVKKPKKVLKKTGK